MAKHAAAILLLFPVSGALLAQEDRIEKLVELLGSQSLEERDN